MVRERTNRDAVGRTEAPDKMTKKQRAEKDKVREGGGTGECDELITQGVRQKDREADNHGSARSCLCQCILQRD